MKSRVVDSVNKSQLSGRLWMRADPQKYKQLFRFSVESSRRGASLIELMVVIALTTALMGAIGLFFQKLFRAEATTRNETRVTRTLQRLEDQFRSDVQTCDSFQLDAPTNTLTIKTADDRTIEYQCRESIVERRVINAAAANPARRELHALPECETALQRLTSAPLQGVTLVIRRPVPVLMSVPQSEKQFWIVEIHATPREIPQPAQPRLSLATQR